VPSSADGDDDGDSVQHLQPNSARVFAYVEPTNTLFGPFVLAQVHMPPPAVEGGDADGDGSSKPVRLAVVPSVHSVHSVVLHERPSPGALHGDETDMLARRIAQDAASSSGGVGGGGSDQRP